MVAFDVPSLRENISQLYDPKSRQEIVASSLRSLPTVAAGIEK